MVVVVVVVVLVVVVVVFRVHTHPRVLKDLRWWWWKTNI